MIDNCKTKLCAFCQPAESPPGVKYDRTYFGSKIKVIKKKKGQLVYPAPGAFGVILKSIVVGTHFLNFAVFYLKSAHLARNTLAEYVKSPSTQFEPPIDQDALRLCVSSSTVKHGSLKGPDTQPMTKVQTV